MATLKDVFWAKIRELHRSKNTGKSYWNWIEEYCRFYAGKDGVPVSPRTLGKDDVVNWLNYLTNHKRVSESAHEQLWRQETRAGLRNGENGITPKVNHRLPWKQKQHAIAPNGKARSVVRVFAADVSSGVDG